MIDSLSVCYISCCLNGFYALQYLKERDIKISVVVSITPDAAARYHVSGYCDMRQWCHDNSVDLVLLDDYQLFVSHINKFNYDILIVNGWNRLVSEEIIKSAQLASIGVHAGHPPVGLGRAPLPWNIIYGHKDIEVYVFVLTDQADDGKICSTKTVEITEYDNVKLLYEKVMYSAAVCLYSAIRLLSNGYIGYSQNLEYKKFYRKRTEKDGLIDFRRSEIDIYNFIRAQTYPYPGAFCFYGEKKWIIEHAQPYDRFSFRDVQRIPGRILLALPSGIVVETGGAPIWLLSVSSDTEKVIPSSLELHKSFEGVVLKGFDQ